VLACGGAASAEGVPSSQPVVLWQILWERVDGQGTQAVLRFLAPEIARDGGSVGFDSAQADMDWLCESHGVPIAALPNARSDSIVVELMDRPIQRGETDSGVTRFFAVYRVDANRCLPEVF
jgi:hypothetical protein